MKCAGCIVNEKLKHIDCFAGILGFSLGLERSGLSETVCAIEIDPFCQKVICKHKPNLPIYSDIRDVTAEKLYADGIIKPGDRIIVTGGYPCQPFSVAGKQLGEADERHLWPEMFRVIQIVKPRWVICENVNGHITNGLDTVLAQMEAEGYTCWPFVIPASAVGAPHNRERVWIVAHSRNNQGRDSQRGSVGRNGEWKLEKEIRADKAVEITGSSSASEIMGNTKHDGQPTAEVTGSTREGSNSSRAGQIETGKLERSSQQQPDVADTEINSTPKPGRTRTGRQGLDNRSLSKRDGGNSDNWTTEPDVGRVAARLSSTLDETIKDYGYENADTQKAVAEIDSYRREILREMWQEQREVKQTPYREESRCCDDFVYEMSCQRTHDRWKLGQRIKSQPNLRNLWKEIHAIGFSQAQDLLTNMLERIREDECNEKVASSRVNRLKALGNSIVPQIAELLGRAILEYENDP